MAQVTLRDLATNEDIVVPPEGFIFGRVGGDADIQIEDNSISRRQARVSLKGGQWLLETLAVPQGTKAPRPIALQEGATFNVGQSEFEVVQVEQDEEEEMDPAAKTIAPPSMAKGKPGPPPAQASSAKKPNVPPNAKTTPSSAQQKRAPAKEEDDGGGNGAVEIPKGGIGALFVGVPKGLAYYLVNVPKLMFNPIGTVKKTIEEQPNEPMGPIALIGYALPAGLITMLLGSWAGGLAALIGPGHVFLIGSFFPIFSLIIGVVVAVVTGFVLHPVMTWIINKLQGKSDARSRTNYFLQLQTVQILFAIPTALVTILTSLPIPLIPLIASILGLLLGVVSALVMMFLQVKWFEFFNVVKWFRTVVLVLTGLGVLGALGRGVDGIRFALATPSTIATPSIPDTSGDAEVAEGDDNSGGLEEMPSDPAEQKAWALKRQKQIEAKQKAAMAAVPKEAKDDGEAAPEPKKTKEAPPEPKTATKEPEPKTAKEPEPKVAEPEPVKDTPPPAKVADAAPTPTGAYGGFFRKREAMERMFDADPTILAKNEDVRKLYSDYLDAVGDVDKKWNKERSKKPELEKLNARLREAELFSKTGKTVDQLAEKLKIR
ncbi:MAG: hypothetical protein QM817_23615 [Archangium sp.]